MYHLLNIENTIAKWIEAFPVQEMLSSVLVCLIILILCLIINAKAKKADPLAKPKGILNIAEIAVTTCDNFVQANMGKIFVKKFSPFIGFCAMYIFLSFIIGLFGFSSPMTFIIVPLSLGLFTFVLIHFTAIKYTKKNYFKRFTSPHWLFVPINIVSMWAPLISISFRLFSNACAGWVLMTLLYGCLKMLSEMIFAGLSLPLAALITPPLHLYFDLFSGLVQTLIYLYLTMLLVSQEVPEDIDVNDVAYQLK